MEGKGDGHCNVEDDGQGGNAGVERDRRYTFAPAYGWIPLLSSLLEVSYGSWKDMDLRTGWHKLTCTSRKAK
jgi:hypothetical protein